MVCSHDIRSTLDLTFGPTHCPTTVLQPPYTLLLILLHAHTHTLRYESYESAEFTFLTTPGQHSEELADHEMNMTLCDYIDGKAGMASQAGMLRKSCGDHKALIDRFGRYPHRNPALGRENTPEEAAWIADYDNLPQFAKSQLPRPEEEKA